MDKQQLIIEVDLDGRINPDVACRPLSYFHTPRGTGASLYKAI
jgi:hypothetical protein